MKRMVFFACLMACLGISLAAPGQDATIRVDVRAAGKPVSRYLAGACIEDVNHEIYGGIYSQMLFGESFQEPPITSPIKDFSVAGGEWEASDGELRGSGGPGPKLVSNLIQPFTIGEAGVDVFLPDEKHGNAAMIVRVASPRVGADEFDGYEIALYADRKVVMLGRHEHDFKMLKEVPCDVAIGKWIKLGAKLGEKSIEIFVDGKSVLQFEDEHPLKPGGIGLRQWQRPAQYRNLWVNTGGGKIDLPFVADPNAQRLSGMWTPIPSPTARLVTAPRFKAPFTGTQSQRLALCGGNGEAGIANEGLNHQGLAFIGGQPYEGYVWLRSDPCDEVFVGLETRDGSKQLAEQKIELRDNKDWRRYDFKLVPTESTAAGRLTIRLKNPLRSVLIGHAFLQPGAWGRFKDLPLRRDVVQGLIDQGVAVLRYGGSMVNSPEYRWKKMIGPRERRPPYRGTWYPYSTNGWGIPDFLNLCEAAGFLGVPDFNIDESPQDMVDFMEYVNGGADTPWGRARAADGHPSPYGLKTIELGNEERLDEAYVAKFTALARAIWAKDPSVTLVVGDFQYERPIGDPLRISGAASGIQSLAAHQKILDLAREHGRDVWFDVHVFTDNPEPSPSLRALPSYIDAIDALAHGARHKVVVFELNSGNARQRRALGNAVAIGTATRDGRLPIVTAANCLQVDGQNDNGWDQGLLFLNPSKVWLQPPGYVTQMIARSYRPVVLPAELTGGADLDVTALRGEDGKSVVLRVVNIGAAARKAQIRLDGFAPIRDSASVEELAAPLDAANTAADTMHVAPAHKQWRHGLRQGSSTYEFPPHSFTVITLD